MEWSAISRWGRTSDSGAPFPGMRGPVTWPGSLHRLPGSGRTDTSRHRCSSIPAMSTMLTCGMPWQHRNSAPDGDQPIRLAARRRTHTSARTACVCDHRTGEMHAHAAYRAPTPARCARPSAGCCLGKDLDRRPAASGRPVQPALDEADSPAMPIVSVTLGDRRVSGRTCTVPPGMGGSVTWPGSLHRLLGSGRSCSRMRVRRGRAPAL